jgi:demethylspheroidene O-methyltransferase
MADPKGARHDAYFHFYLLAMGEGRLRTPEQLMAMMRGAGFEHVKLLSNPMPIHTRILVAQKY